jgi:hypothetical protein
MCFCVKNVLQTLCKMCSAQSVWPTPSVRVNCTEGTYTECLVPSVVLDRFCSEYSLGSV